MKYIELKVHRNGRWYELHGQRADNGEWMLLVSGFKRMDDAVRLMGIMMRHCVAVQVQG